MKSLYQNFYAHSTILLYIEVCPSGKSIGGIANTIASTTNPIISIFMECSNMGKCDRDSGTCTCFEPFEGAACNRCKISTIYTDVDLTN